MRMTTAGLFLTGVLILGCAALDRGPIPDEPIQCDAQLDAWRAALVAAELDNLEIKEVDEGPLAGVSDREQKAKIIQALFSDYSNLALHLESGDWQSVDYLLPKLEPQTAALSPAFPEHAPLMEEALVLARQASATCH